MAAEKNIFSSLCAYFIKRMIKNKKGLALIAAIMLIVFISIAVLGLSVFIVQWYKQIDAQERQSRCIYNAMAGVNYAIYQYRVSGALTNGTTAIDANNNFTLSTVSTGGGTAASALVIDARASSLQPTTGNPSGRYIDLSGVTLQNNSASAITINQAIVTWTTASRTMTQIVIGGVTNWSGSATPSPATVNFTTNATINAGATVALTRIRWNSAMTGATITIRFRMTDGTTTDACTLFPQQPAVCTQPGTNLTIKSMGKTTGSNQYRSVQATYNIATGNVSDYDEISQTVP